MGYSSYLKELLRPLGLYDLSDGAINVGELEAAGGVMDLLDLQLEDIQREMLLTTAEGLGPVLRTCWYTSPDPWT